jgi:hypothetical protein
MGFADVQPQNKNDTESVDVHRNKRATLLRFVEEHWKFSEAL